MYQTGHYGAALLAWAPVGYTLLAVDPVLALVGGAGALALATLPDVDHKLPLVSHRGVTHTIPFLLVVSGALAAVGWHLGQGSYQPYGGSVRGATFGFVVGVVGIGSHLLADVLTPMGVKLLWPFSRRNYSLRLTPAKNPLANWTLLVLGLLASGAALAVARDHPFLV